MVPVAPTVFGRNQLFFTGLCLLCRGGGLQWLSHVHLGTHARRPTSSHKTTQVHHHLFCGMPIVFFIRPDLPN